ncbi:MAG: TlpA disulfide reductase family protein [Saprospiraceae bacterium]|nr:TlpA disulfide reductase family protein [Saprospiraceae bacterium]
MNNSRFQFLVPVWFGLCCLPLTLTAQEPFDASATMREVNNRIAAVSKGWFEVAATFKFSSGNDTLRHAGTCYFFKETPGRDSVAHFAVFVGDTLVYAYDGQVFCDLWDDGIYRVTFLNETVDVADLMRGNVRKSNLLIDHLLGWSPAFTPEAYDSVLRYDVLRDGVYWTRLQYLDTIEDRSLGYVEDNEIVLDINLYLDTTLNPREKEGFVWLFDGWQYDKKVLSPIVPLPPEAALRDYFLWDSLAVQGRWEEYNPYASDENGPQLIGVGESLPVFALADLNGDTVKLDDLSQGLILLDFWYKSCYPCRVSMPTIESLHQSYGPRGLRVYGVNPFDAEDDKLQGWLRARNVTYNTLLDPLHILPEACGVTGYPTLLLIDAVTRKVLYAQAGFSESTDQELTRLIEKGLK